MKAVIFILFVAVFAISAVAQKNVEFNGNATLEETSRWLTENFAKYSEYKTSGREFEVSKVKFAACKLSYTTMTRFSSTNTDTMGAHVRRSNSKRELVLDLSVLDPAAVITADHLYPDMKYLRIAKRASSLDPIELSIKYEAADATRAAFSRAITLCKPN